MGSNNPMSQAKKAEVRELFEDNLRERVAAWTQACLAVDKLVAEHGVKSYDLGGPLNRITRVTELDQHIDNIIRVADWLLDNPE